MASQFKMNFLLLLALFLFPSYSIADEISVCKEAKAASDYGTALALPEATKRVIEFYRESWRDVCFGKNKKQISLAYLLANAYQIESLINLAIEQLDNLPEGKDGWKQAEIIHTLLSEKYPAFIPGFDGSYIEYTYFKPSFDEFGKAAQFGNEEDKTFFKQYSTEIISPPWIQLTWDYGGCTLYGEFDWIKRLNMTQTLYESLKNRIYRDINSSHEKEMLDELTEAHDVCTCGKKESVLPDLNSVAALVKDNPRFVETYKKINEKINAIGSGKLIIQSEAEGHCSGG